MIANDYPYTLLLLLLTFYMALHVDNLRNLSYVNGSSNFAHQNETILTDIV